MQDKTFIKNIILINDIDYNKLPSCLNNRCVNKNHVLI